MMESKRVLIVGKTSYIAKSMIAYCGLHPLNTVQLQFDAISAKNGEWKKTDFSSYDTVILFSGIAHRKAEASLYYEVNHRMAVEIAAYAKQNHVKQFILMSTIAVCGEQIVIQDQVPVVAPVNDYGKSKKMAEDDIKAMEDENFGVAIIRAPMVYGKGCPGNFTRLVHLIDRVHLYPVYTNKRSAIYIDHLSEFLQQVTANNCRGTYVPQNAQYLSSDEIAKSMKKQGKRICLVHGCSWLVKLGMKLSGQMRKMFGDYEYPLELSRYEGLDYQIYSIEETIQQSIE